jgi:hypothetical protein
MHVTDTDSYAHAITKRNSRADNHTGTNAGCSSRHAGAYACGDTDTDSRHADALRVGIVDRQHHSLVKGRRNPDSRWPRHE